MTAADVFGLIAAAAALLGGVFGAYRLGVGHGRTASDPAVLSPLLTRIATVEAAVLEIRAAIVGSLGGVGITGRLGQIERRLDEIEARLERAEQHHGPH